VKKDEFTHLGKGKPYQIVRHFAFLVGWLNAWKKHQFENNRNNEKRIKGNCFLCLWMEKLCCYCRWCKVQAGGSKEGREHYDNQVETRWIGTKAFHEGEKKAVCGRGSSSGSGQRKIRNGNGNVAIVDGVFGMVMSVACAGDCFGWIWTGELREKSGVLRPKHFHYNCLAFDTIYPLLYYYYQSFLTSLSALFRASKQYFILHNLIPYSFDFIPSCFFHLFRFSSSSF